MSLLIEFSRRAAADISAAYGNYTTIQTLLAEQFLSELKATVDFIALFPQAAQIVVHGSATRRAVMRRFPYIIAYHVVDDRLIILRVRSSRQNPKTLLK